MKSEEVASLVTDVIRSHHDAFIVQTVGADNSGLSPERIKRLIGDGFLREEQLAGYSIPQSKSGTNPFHFSRHVSSVMNAAGPANRATMRNMPLSAWVRAVDASLSEIAPEVAIAPHFTLPDAPPIAGPPSAVPVKGPPTGPPLSGQEQQSYQQAAERAGSYIRGLGNKIAENTNDLIKEAWDGEQILLEADPKLRQDTVDIVQETVSEAVRQRKSVKQLKSDLGHATKDWARDWERIARTEIQGSYNEGAIMDAIQMYGAEAKIARVPESGACKHCIRLFLDNEGGINVFSIQGLLSNGTNVGKRGAQWLATAWPVHPNCRCDTVTVPPGMKIGKDGVLLPEEEKE